MSEILQYVITSLFSLLAGGGIGSIFYFKQQKKLKEMEVKAAEASVKSDEITTTDFFEIYNRVFDMDLEE